MMKSAVIFFPIRQNVPKMIAATKAHHRRLKMSTSPNPSNPLYVAQHKFDSEYPGTAVERMLVVRERVKALTQRQLSEDWQIVRKYLLWAGGLNHIEDSVSVTGSTSECFNDFNHCDLVCVKDDFVSSNSLGLSLGLSMSLASIPDLGFGKSWTTCMIGCNDTPPRDMAHLQLKSRVAFKLVWVPHNYSSFVIVDDSGNLLNLGTPSGQLPDLFERVQNYKIVHGSKYSTAAKHAMALCDDQRSDAT